MKLGKEEIQKLVLGGLLLLGVVYSYFDLLLFPLLAHQEANRNSTTALGPEIENARAQIKKVKDLEKNVPTLTMTLSQVNAMIPEGSPVAWFPTKMGEFFKREGIEKTTTKLNSEIVEKELPGYRRLAWGIDLPKINFGQFGSAVCTLENQEPLLEINTMQIDASREDVEAQHALITVRNIVKE